MLKAISNEIPKNNKSQTDSLTSQKHNNLSGISTYRNESLDFINLNEISSPVNYNHNYNDYVNLKFINNQEFNTNSDHTKDKRQKNKKELNDSEIIPSEPLNASYIKSIPLTFNEIFLRNRINNFMKTGMKSARSTKSFRHEQEVLKIVSTILIKNTNNFIKMLLVDNTPINKNFHYQKKCHNKLLSVDEFIKEKRIKKLNQSKNEIITKICKIEEEKIIFEKLERVNSPEKKLKLPPLPKKKKIKEVKNESPQAKINFDNLTNFANSYNSFSPKNFVKINSLSKSRKSIRSSESLLKNKEENHIYYLDKNKSVLLDKIKEIDNEISAQNKVKQNNKEKLNEFIKNLSEENKKRINTAKNQIPRISLIEKNNNIKKIKQSNNKESLNNTFHEKKKYFIDMQKKYYSNSLVKKQEYLFYKNELKEKQIKQIEEEELNYRLEKMNLEKKDYFKPINNQEIIEFSKQMQDKISELTNLKIKVKHVNIYVFNRYLNINKSVTNNNNNICLKFFKKLFFKHNRKFFKKF